MTQLAGKVAIVTGSTQGLGEGIAVALANAGASVIANGRSAARGANVMSRLGEIGGDHRFIAADVSIEAEAKRLVEEAAAHAGRLDILINNAQAIAPSARLEDSGRSAAFAETLASGLYASLWTAQAALPFMRATGGGRIVNFGSINGVYGAKFGSHYNATKEAMRGLTATMANEWGQYGITVNMVLPAGLSPTFEAFIALDPARGEAMARQHPMRRHGRSEEDIGAAVVGLVSDHARFITGQALFLDGGANLLGLPQFNVLEDAA